METDGIATFDSFDGIRKKTIEIKKNKEVQQQRKERSIQLQRPAEKQFCFPIVVKKIQQTQTTRL